MKKLALIGLACSSLFFSSCYKSQAPKSDVVLDSTGKAVSSVDAPIITFEQDIFNFGVLVDGDVVEHEFSFTNTGKTPLIISGAEATCGCTVPSIPEKPINPGEKGKIMVSFNSAGKVGMHDKIITLITNANPSFAYVHMVGEVKPMPKN